MPFQRGFTALIMAACSNCKKVVELLIRRGSVLELEALASECEYFPDDDSSEHKTDTNFDLWYFSHVNLK